MNSLTTQLRSRWFALKGAKRPVPEGFMKLDYLESTGTQWIDTGIYGSQDIDYSVEFSVTPIGGQTFYSIMGDRVSSTECRYSLMVNVNSSLFYANCGNNNEITGRYENTSSIHYVVKSGLDVYLDGNKKGTFLRQTFSTPNTITLFATRTDGVLSNNMAGKIYTARLSGSDYQPLLALPGTTYIDGNTGNPVTAADFKPGMYDYVSNRFFVNQATSGEDFLYIPDNEVWYAADSKQTLYKSTGVVSHEFADGRGVLKFASAVTTVLTWLRGTAVTAVVLPKTVTSIGNQAFYGCSSLALEELPAGLTSIGDQAFYGCSSLALEELPAGLTSIGGYAFFGCWNTGSYHALTFLGTPSSIPASAFVSNAKLTDIYVPWSEGEVAGAPWSATNATIHYNSTPTE